MTMTRKTGELLLKKLVAAAAPYGLRAEQRPDSLMPDLVFSRDSDGREIARLRWFDGAGPDPFLRTIIPEEISDAEQRAVEEHLTALVAPVILDNFSYGA